MPPDWWIDERANAGAEHLDPERVRQYDEKNPFDPSHEIAHLGEYGLAEAHTVLDIGAGTGSFALAAATHCDRVIAIDASPVMLDELRRKADERGITTIEVVESGITDYAHDGDPAAIAFSRNTLHHLPDFFKVEALKRIAAALEPGGIFRFRDLVFAFDPWESEDAIEGWLDESEGYGLPRGELTAHLREEYSTYGFLLESMLESVGFELLDREYDRNMYGRYTCRVRED